MTQAIARAAHVAKSIGTMYDERSPAHTDSDA